MTENPHRPFFEHGELQLRIVEAIERAQERGALHPIETSLVQVADHDVTFAVRVACCRSDLADEKSESRQHHHAAAERDPFLPVDSDLHVADVSDTHVAVLNKYPVMERHILVVTRRHEHQDELLTVADFYAAWRCLAEADGLVFFNCGIVAGASQQHKHLQFIPYPLSDSVSRPPIDGLVEESLNDNRNTVSCFVFRHVLAAIEWIPTGDPSQSARTSHLLYLEMLKQAGVALSVADTTKTSPYNLLLTRRWMIVIPRRREAFEGISINGLGFAGCLFLRDASQLEIVKLAGPMHALETVAGSTRA